MKRLLVAKVSFKEPSLSEKPFPLIIASVLMRNHHFLNCCSENALYPPCRRFTVLLVSGNRFVLQSLFPFFVAFVNFRKENLE